MSRLETALALLGSCSPKMTGRDLVELSRRVWDVPLQVRLTREQVLDFVSSQKENTVCRSKITSKELAIGSKIIQGSLDDRTVFPLKHHPGSSTKVNVFLNDIAKDANNYCKLDISEILGLIQVRGRLIEGRKIYNDEAAGWLTWCVACSLQGIPICPLLSMSYDELSDFSNKVKGLGVAGSPLLHLLAEPKVLAGRGVKKVDWEEEIKKRTNPEDFEGMLASFEDKELMHAIEEVVREERGVFVAPSWKKAWATRFSTTKAGSHVRSYAAKVNLPKRQLTRRNYVEAVERSEIWDKPPGGLISASEKLETGATRAIFSLDSDNYLRFDAPAKALERCWRNYRSILKPAEDSSSIEIEKRAALLKKYHIMFDYTDFNSAHTLKAMKMVIRVAFRGLEDSWLDWLEQSIDNMYVKCPLTGEMKHFGGTLPSGHRLTTIINTILNAAYMRIVLKGEYHNMRMLHVGDDVVASCESAESAARAVQLVMSSCLNMNPSKQGFGTVCAEFLRVSYTKHHAVGYFCRSVANGVAGNWVTTRQLSCEEYSEAVANLIWTWRQRGQHDLIPMLWVSTIVRRLGFSESEAVKICSGSGSINGSPMWGDVRQGSVYHLVGGTRNKRTPRVIDGVRLPTHAAREYRAISKEYNILVREGITRRMLDEAMLEASYGNMADIGDETRVKWIRSDVRIGMRFSRGKGKVLKSRWSVKTKPGLLVSAVKGVLTDAMWSNLGDQLGFDHRPYLSSAAKKISCFMFGTPYSDAREIQTYLKAHVRYTQQYLVLV